MTEKVVPLPRKREAAEPPAATRECPLCGKPTRAETRPFCSRRCAELDLGRWLRGIYRVPTAEPVSEAPSEADDE